MSDRSRGGALAPALTRTVCIAILGYAAGYVALYPPTFSILDEQAYLAFADLIAHGTVYAEDAGTTPARTWRVDEHRVPRTPLGTSMLLAPLARWWWRGSFAVMGALHVVAVLAFAAAARRLGLSPGYAVVLLLHPVAVLYARTAMSDVPSMALSALALSMYVAPQLGPRRGPLLAGSALGAMLHFRFGDAVVVGGVLAASLARELASAARERRVAADARSARARERGTHPAPRTMMLAIGTLPGVISALAVNTALYGGPLDLPLTWPLSVTHLPSNLAFYLVALDVALPGGLLLGLAYPSPVRVEAAVAGAAALLLYGCFAFVYAGYGAAAWVIGARFFLPVLPWLLVGYVFAARDLCALVSRKLGARAATALGAVAVLGLATAALAISVVHQRELSRQADVQQRVYGATRRGALIVVNPNAREYLLDSIGERRAVPSTALFGPSGALRGEAKVQIDAAIPDAFALTVVRDDRPDPSRERAEAAIELLRTRYALDEVFAIERPPHVATLHRIAALRPTR